MAKKDFMAAFLREREQSEAVSKLDTVNVTPLATNMIGESSDNFYHVDDIDDLVESIREHGLLHPIVTNNGTTVISGHRRLAAYRRLLAETGDEKYKMIPCIVLHPADPIESEMMMIEANSTARVLTPYELMEQAKRYDALLVKAKEHGYECEGRRRDIVAKMMKVSPSRVGRFGAINKNLSSEWMWLFQSNEIPESVAYEISKLDMGIQMALLDKFLDSKGHVSITIADVQQFVADRQKAKEEPDPDLESEPESQETEQTSSSCGQALDQLDELIAAVPNTGGESSPYDYIGQRFKLLREEKNFTRREMADYLGWFNGTYSAIENGDACSLDRLCDAAKKLGVSLDWLVGFSDNRTGGISVRNGRDRLTHERCSGMKSGYWSPAKKDELIDRLAEYENAEDSNG